MSEAAAPGRARADRVLLLPGTRRDAEVICAYLAAQNVDCQLCLNAAEAAEEISRGVGALVLTDQVLIGPGAQLILASLEGQPDWSDLPVVLLSKVGEESRAVAGAMAAMANVTVLDRPTSTRTLLSAIQAALRARTKQYQIRDQLLELQAAENALRLLDRRKDEFLAMLAHELRNPLAPIRTAADLLPRLIAAGDSRIESTLGIVDRQVQQLTRLVDDLLDVSRITQGRIEMQRAVVDLSGIVRQALESVEPLMRDKHHTIVASLSDGLYVEGDSARLVQCLSNVLTNAAKYTDESGEITVSIGQAGGRAHICIADNGVGIAPDLLPRIFELFVQSERSLDRSQGGLGIGLSVVKQLIEMQGGEVLASSPGPGCGSTFDIFLPLTAAPEQAAIETVAQDTGALRVLVVDDNEDAAESLATLLSCEGHEAEAIYGAQAALDRVAEFKPDLILLDIGLPHMNGYEVARRLRQMGARARIVALSGYGQKEDVQRALDAGFNAHAAKPIEFSALRRILRPGA